MGRDKQLKKQCVGSTDAERQASCDGRACYHDGQAPHYHCTDHYEVEFKEPQLVTNVATYASWQCDDHATNPECSRRGV